MDFRKRSIMPCETYFIVQEVRTGIGRTILNNLIGTFLVIIILAKKIGKLANLTAVRILSLSSNQFVGKIPRGYGNFSSLQVMDLSYNRLSGNIPSELSRLSALQVLSFSGNSLTGGIPSSFGQLRNLAHLELRGNELHGSIPSEIGAIHHLRVLDLGQNYFYGRIPPSLCNLTSLFVMLLDSNTGYLRIKVSITITTTQPDSFKICTIPTEIGNLNRSLGVLNLSYNLVEGTLPVGLCVLENLFELLLGNNRLQGSLPHCIVHIRSLVVLQLYTNMLTGTLPPDLDKLGSLYYLDFGSNYFTGTIPESIGNIGATASKLPLNYLFLNYNLFTGGIPPLLMRLDHLYEFYLNNNFLTGPLPENVGNLTRLNIFCVHNNMLTGHLPSSFSNLHSLVELFVEDNNFTGPIGQIFNSSVQRILSDIDLSSNSLSGTLPADVFSLKSLNSFAAVSNCITGSLPMSICEADQLNFLALDGMNTAANCRKPIFPAIKWLTTYTRVHNLEDGIPSCVFNLSSLQTLHLSGVGLNYALPSDLVISPTLSDLSLSNNIVTGIIPDSIQLRYWNNLDLSYNRITGTLRSDFPAYPSTSALNLAVNRLSGDIPTSLMYSLNISILEGNLFSCDSNRYPLPVNDPHYDNYACGSNSFDTSLIIWSGFCSIYLICAIALVLALRYLKQLEAYYNYLVAFVLTCSTSLAVWMSVFYENGGELGKDCPNIYQLGHFLKNLRSTAFWLTVGIIVVFLPLLIVLTYVSYSLTYEYTWTITIAYISGQNAAYILLVFLMLWLIVSMWAFNRNVLALFPIERKPSFKWSSFNISSFCSLEAIKTDPVVRGHFYHNSLLAVVFFANILFVVPMNCLYIYITIYYDSTVVDLAQLGMAVFKIIWMDFTLTEILRRAAVYSTDTGLSILSHRGSGSGSSSITSKESGNQVDNEVTNAPIDERDVDLTRRTLELELEARSIVFHVFLVLLNNIGFPIVAALFISSNCFINAFIPAPAVDASYQYLICASTFGLYRGLLCTDRVLDTVYTSYDPPFQYSYQCSSVLIVNFSTIYVYMFTLVGFVGPMFKVALKLIHYRLYGETESSSEDALRKWLDLIVPPVLLPLYSEIPPQLPLLFDRRRFIVRILAFISIFLSYGVTCSPVAVVLLAGIVSTTVFDQACIGRLLTLDAEKRGNKDSSIISSSEQLSSSRVGYRQILDKETEGICALVAPTVWVICPFLSFFYAFFIFDVMGSEVGWRSSVAYAILMACTPIIVWMAIKLYQVPIVQEYVHTNDEDGRPTLLAKVFSEIFVEPPQLSQEDILRRSSRIANGYGNHRRTSNMSMALNIELEHRLTIAWDNRVEADRDTFNSGPVSNPIIDSTTSGKARHGNDSSL
eukprot:gene30042-39233_t